MGTSANTLGQVVVTAPIDGVVADWNTTSGQSVQDAGAKLMTIVNGTQVLVTANIYEKDLAQVKLGQSVNVRVIGLKDKTFTGTINRIGAVVGEGRVVPVQAQLNNVSGELKPGMSAELAVMTGQSGRAVIAVPRTAIVDVNGQKLVYVQTGEDGFKSKIVELGEISGDRVEVTHGLVAGDRIVTQRTTQLYAQSLRGGAAADEHGDEKAGEHGDENKATPQKPANAETLATIPPWGWGAGMGLLMGGTAWTLYRRRQQNAIAIDEMDEEELVMNHHVLPSAADETGLDRDRGIEAMADRQRN
ncbi:MAG: efflux RND transporter periplasmic adaptor subunit [Chamaesiphon sp.]|nr:efflux RND transporter periplasmic adaptor subunit [Chamaesiphon sp.]